MPEVSKESMDGTRYARYGGLAFGVFLVIWSLVGYRPLQARSGWWDGFAHTEPYVYAFFGAWLLLPWKRIGQGRHWNKAYAVLCFLCVVFAFVLVTEVMALNYLAKDMSLRAKPPVFQGILMFAALGQIPTLLFFRRPELLD